MAVILMSLMICCFFLWRQEKARRSFAQEVQEIQLDVEKARRVVALRQGYQPLPEHERDGADATTPTAPPCPQESEESPVVAAPTAVAIQTSSSSAFPEASVYIPIAMVVLQ